MIRKIDPLLEQKAIKALFKLGVVSEKDAISILVKTGIPLHEAISILIKERSNINGQIIREIIGEKNAE